MCGRYDLDATAEELVERFGVPSRDLSVPLTAGVAGVTTLGSGAPSNVRLAWRPKYNIAPSEYNPVVVKDDHGRNRLELMRWGLVPAWSKDAKVAYSTINARAETVASKPAFRRPLATQRCLVPATGYFEWVESASEGVGGKGKQPYRIRLRSDGASGIDGICSLAGLYDMWRGPDGQELHTYTIVTTEANEALRAIHSRMPVILPRDAEAAWLDHDGRDTEQLISLLRPYPAEGMSAYPVSRLVNSPGNEGRALIEPAGRAYRPAA